MAGKLIKLCVAELSFRLGQVCLAKTRQEPTWQIAVCATCGSIQDSSGSEKFYRSDSSPRRFSKVFSVLESSRILTTVNSRQNEERQTKFVQSAVISVGSTDACKKLACSPAHAFQKERVWAGKQASKKYGRQEHTY